MWDYVHSIFILVVAYSAPATFIFVSVSLAMLGFGLQEHIRKISVMAISTAVVGNLFIFVLPQNKHFIYYTAIYLVCFFLLFRTWSALPKWSAAVLAYLLQLLNETVWVSIALRSMSREQLLANFSDLALYFWPSLALFALFAFVLERTGPERVLARIGRDPRESAVRSAHEFYMREMNDMYNAIRGQRHDFLNHIQVIASMLANRKYAEADKYIHDLYKDTQQIRDWIDIGHPGFSALIQAKLALSLSRDIRLDYTFSGLENLPLDIKSIDVVRISGNLLDNAIDAVTDFPKADRWVEISGVSAEDHLYIAVRNPGPVLREEDIRNCFHPGYTTKTKGNHKGIGLQIVKEKVEEYKGTLQARSNEDEGTVFTVRIPY